MDQRLKEYIEKFCKKHDIAIDNAFEYAPVRAAAEYYAHVDDGKVVEKHDENKL